MRPQHSVDRIVGDLYASTLDAVSVDFYSNHAKSFFPFFS